jgi:hypothetical protein
MEHFVFTEQSEMQDEIHGSVYNSSFQAFHEHGPSSFMPQPQAPIIDSSLQSSEAVQRAARKRAPKVPTMSAEKWEPANSRIRQFFVDGQCSYKEVMDIVNKEFEFTAK